MSIVVNTIHTGDSLVVLRDFPADTIDAIVTDPPYGISYQGRNWDADVPAVEIWKQALRILKPGGHLVSFAGARTYHRMATNIELAGFEIRDQIMWLYSTGFPRSHNIHLALERKHGTTVAQNWRGWGTTLKPAHEPIVIARKPFVGVVAENVLAFGTGGLNIDGCRVPGTPKAKKRDNVIPFEPNSKGRFPANVVHDGLDEPWAPYFYCAKPTTKERDRGLEAFKLKAAHERTNSKAKGHTAHCGAEGAARNFHPTVKPIALMEHLVRLVTPSGGVVLDPFAGSGSTLIAAKNLGFSYIGIDQDFEYVKLAEARLAA